MKDDVTNAVINYIQDNHTDYAILINGEWGSGKTYHWKNSISKAVKDINWEPVYVSLYNVATVDDIAVKVLLSQVGVLEGIENSRLAEIAKACLSFTSSITSVLTGRRLEFGSLYKVDMRKIIDMKNIVICLDDFERSRAACESVMGYINDLVEHYNVKVVILADENKICEKSATEDMNNFYNIRKEKTIGKTVKFISNIPQIILSIINESSAEISFHKHMCSKVEMIEEILEQSTKKNFRILRRAINEFRNIFAVLNDKNDWSDTPEYQVYLDLVLTFVLAYSLEVRTDENKKEGFIEIDKLSDLKQRDISSRMFSKSEDPVAEFYRRYFNKSFEFSIYLKHLTNYLDTNILNKDTFMEEFSKDMETDNIPEEEKLFGGYVYNLSEEEAREICHNTLKNLENGNIEYSKYFKAMIKYKQLIDCTALFMDLEELERIIITGLNIAAGRAREPSSHYDISIFDEGISSTAIGRSVLSEYDKLDKEIEKRNKIDILSNFNYAISKGDTKTLRWIATSLSNFPFLSHLVLQELFTSLRLADNNVILFIADLIKSRYSNKDDLEPIVEDLEALTSLNDWLQGEIKIHVEEFSLRRGVLSKLLTEIIEAGNAIKSSNNIPHIDENNK